MPNVKFTSNAKEVAIIISKWPSIVDGNYKAILEASGKRLKRNAQVYPSRPAGSRYVRTGELGRGWRVSAVQNSSLSVVNRVKHGPWVQKATKQAKVHKGRWQTDEDLAKKEAKELEEQLNNGLLDGIV